MIILSQRLLLIFLELLPVRYCLQTYQDNFVSNSRFFCDFFRIVKLFSTAIATLEDIYIKIIVGFYSSAVHTKP